MVKKNNDSTLKKFSHNQGQNWYHLVLVPKKRFPLFQWKVLRDLANEAIEEVCANHNIEIFEYEVMEDHVHLFITCPPNYGINKLIKVIKGGTSFYIRKKYPSLKKYEHLWSRGCTYRGISNVTAQTVDYYIKNSNVWKGT